MRPETRINLARTAERSEWQERQPDVAKNRTLVIPEAEGTKLITVLHNDGTATVIRIEPHHTGIELHIELGWGKVLNDLTIHRSNGGDNDH